MSAEAPDAIHVDLPIGVTEEGTIRVDGIATYSRELWRHAANNPNKWNSAIHAIARAVVAWIERDEFEALPIPEVGRRIKATLRDGREVEGKVTHVYRGPRYVSIDLNSRSTAYIDTSPDGDETPRDITAWEYPDEPSPTLADIADQLEVVVKQLREVVQ